jgi:hypothetical protein
MLKSRFLASVSRYYNSLGGEHVALKVSTNPVLLRGKDKTSLKNKYT